MNGKFLIIYAIALGMSFPGVSCSHLPNKYVYSVDESTKKNPTVNPPPEENGSTIKGKEEKTAGVEAKFEAKQVLNQKVNGLPDGALTHKFNAGMQQTWDKTFETMLAFPLISSDKSGGVILTDWIIDPKSQKGDDLPMFGAGPTLVRYRYVVKIYDANGTTEVLLVQLAQRSSTHIWVERPPLKEMTAKLMDKIILNIGN